MSSTAAQRIETGRRLKKARAAAGLTADATAEELNVSSQTVFNWESGRQFPEPPKLGRLASLYGVSVDHLLGLAEEEPQRSVAAVLRELTTRFEALELVEVPILGVVPAGDPVTPFELADEYVRVPADLIAGVRQPFALRIAGSSLSDIGVQDGQIALVDTDAELVDGKVYVVQINDQVTAKRLFRNNGGLRLEGANGSVEIDDSAEVKNLGRIVGAGAWREL